jgi:hypothetical protein
LDSRYFQAKKKVRAMTGTMISSISIVDTTISRPCWAATSPDGFSTTMLQPASRAASTRRAGPRRVLRSGMPGARKKNVGRGKTRIADERRM